MAVAAQETKGSGGSFLGTIGGFLIVALVAAGLGAGYAFKMDATPKLPGTEAITTESAPAGKETPAGKGKEPVAPPSGLYDLKPIVANLTFPTDVWIRLEVTVQLEKMPPPDADILLIQLTSDIEAFLHTLSLPQLQGAAGLQNLREDLQERLAVRSKGRVHDLFIRGLVLQ